VREKFMIGILQILSGRLPKISFAKSRLWEKVSKSPITVMCKIVSLQESLWKIKQKKFF